jgi:hypothetical protein
VAVPVVSMACCVPSERDRLGAHRVKKVDQSVGACQGSRKKASVRHGIRMSRRVGCDGEAAQSVLHAIRVRAWESRQSENERGREGQWWKK